MKTLKQNLPLILLCFCVSACATKMNKRHPVSIIYIDEKTEASLGDFPLKRNHYVQLVKSLQAYAPHSVVLKFFFDAKTDEDKSFKEIEDVRVYTQASALPSSTEWTGAIPNDLGKNVIGLQENFSVLYPNKTIYKSLDGAGFVDAPTNKEGQPRDFYLLRAYRRNLYPSLPLLILADVEGESPQVHRNKVVVGSRVLPMDNDGVFHFDYNKDRSLYRQHSFIDVIEGNVSKDAFKNHIVVVFYQGPKLIPVKAANGLKYNPAEVVSDAINNVLLSSEQ